MKNTECEQTRQAAMRVAFLIPPQYYLATIIKFDSNSVMRQFVFNAQ